MYNSKKAMFKVIAIVGLITLVIIVSISVWPCQKNKKIDRLTLFISSIQSDYSNISSEEWEFYDSSLNELIKDIKSCSSEITENDISYIEEQESIYRKVKIKWKIENILDLGNDD